MLQTIPFRIVAFFFLTFVSANSFCFASDVGKIPTDIIYDYPNITSIPDVSEPKVIPLVQPASTCDEGINLEDASQDFVLESKQIIIKEYPNAFNPTIVRFQGKLLMCFRTYEPVTKSTDNIGMVWLDENFELESAPSILQVPVFPTGMVSKKQDPRLIVVGDKLIMVLNNSIKGVLIPEVRRMFLTEIHLSGDQFYTDPLEPLFNYQGEREQRWEKNWTPFVYDGELLLAYSLFPHRILRPLTSLGICEEFALTNSSFNWNFGHIRGGTQAYLDGDKYLGFFHSSINMATVHSNGKVMPHYVMGAYLFSKEPPFEITHMSPEPIIGKGFYTGPAYKTWKPLRVVFPDGFVFDENYVWITYGKQDHEIWLAKIDKKKLIDSLIPVVLR